MHRYIVLSSPKRCFRRKCSVNFCSTKSVSAADHDHDDDPLYSDEAKYPKEIPSIFDNRLSTNRANEEYLKTWLPNERTVLANIVKNLGTAQEKIEFVNPYERDWKPWEHHRHRLFHRPLTSPRKSYPLSPIPRGYNSLNLYKFVTQTHCIKKLPDIYDKISIQPSQTIEFRDRLIDIITLEKCGRQDFHLVIDSVIDQIVNSCVILFGADFDHIRNAQIGTNVRYEAFVERGGFHDLYYKLKTPRELDEENFKRKKQEGKPVTKSIDSQPIDKYSLYKMKKVYQRRLTCDGFYRLGELSFCFRDTANAHFRYNLPLPQFLDLNDPICRTPVPECTFSPMDFNVMPDPDPLWMVPGYEHGDQHEFGSLMINSFKDLKSRLRLWDAEPEEFEECLTSAAISSCFSWLSGQAHYLGFNHFNDLEYPLTTQAVFTDCQDWYFAAYQLNTLDMKHKFDQDAERKCNICYLDGPHKLFDLDENGNLTNINEKTLETFLKFLFHRPASREAVQEFRPYIAKHVEKPVTHDEILEIAVKKVSDIVYDLPK